MKRLKRLGLILLLVLMAAGAYFMLRPQPVPVDLVTIARKDMETTVEEEGVTRVKSVYRVSAPITGKLERLSLQAGDEVAKGERLARIRPVDPPIRDIRTRRELAAATKAAQAGVKLAQTEIIKARSALEFAETELARAVRLAESSTISERALQQAEFEVELKSAQLAEAQANLELRRYELESARARELEPLQLSATMIEDQCCVAVVAPEAGSVLEVFSESEQVVQAGTRLLDVGNVHALEVVVDLLSVDAVAIHAGTPAKIEDWGGEEALGARVRRIDPAGFTKVSALGIEEQRVNVILDISDPPQRWRKLGHAYRVGVSIITQQQKDVLQIPLSALFRQGGKWAAYVEDEGRAALALLELGQFSQTHAEIISGLEAGMRVIVYPSDRVGEGTLIAERMLDAQ